MHGGRRRDKRRTIRVACALPVRIRTRTGWLDVHLLDLSRGGLRIGLPVEAVDVSSEASLLDVARRLGTLLPERIDAAIGTGGAVTRALRVVRLCKQAESGGEVELGCLFDRPFDDEDALELGIVLPREGESWDQAERRLDELKTIHPESAASPP